MTDKKRLKKASLGTTLVTGGTGKTGRRVAERLEALDLVFRPA